MEMLLKGDFVVHAPDADAPRCSVAGARAICYLIGTMIDYHLHGNFSGHATGELGEYVEAALEKGFREIGFSDHLPKVVNPDPYHAMLEEHLPRYVDRVLSLQSSYRDRITIKLGIEADYFIGYESETKRLIDSYPFDYVLGALHFLGDWHFTSKQGLARYESEDPAEAFPRYFALLKRMIATGLFDIVAHPDALRRGAFKPVRSMETEHREIARLLRSKGMAIELNTAGIRRGVGSVYPDRGFLAECVAEGIPITLGSDAHTPADVGRDYGAALRLLSDLGVSTIATYEKRRLAEMALDTRLDKA
jgi:histidinol-phosphatase (PHP family)